MARRTPDLTVIGGGLAGLTAAITAAEAGARVTLHEAHHTLGGRARTAGAEPGEQTQARYRTHNGPHALYAGGPHWTWLKRRDLLGPVTGVPLHEAARLRFHRGGVLRRTPPAALLRLLRHRPEHAPVDEDFTTWAGRVAGVDGARAAAHYTAVALFHHDPGSLSARFVQERLRRTTALPPEAHYPLGGWSAVVDRMAARAWNLGVRVETLSRLDTVPTDTPVVVATSLEAARRLLRDPTLTWDSGRTALVDLALRRRRGDAFAVSGIDFPAWIERFTAQDPSLAPSGESLLQGQVPLAPHESAADGSARAELLLDLAYPGWRSRTVWRRDAVAQGRTGALDRPGTTWRDRPAIDRGDGVYLAGDMVAAPGVLSEVSFTSAIEATTLALRRAVPAAPGLDLKFG
ncbi:NAD(P)-binding protein [Streptomyces sp. SID5785]|uniref:NAD(P)-binding protein n=1 Tax=Streptomyces sp. SID5785 TaxID=2690309 RepID=UPI001361CD6F|nr:NAD(P)-binding protein [Streptomyces sp. SID5785]MZD06799.1 NAD(P)-binding protein [Streptomyces sp. SID5785]